jgi:hypothetical protein
MRRGQDRSFIEVGRCSQGGCIEVEDPGVHAGGALQREEPREEDQDRASSSWGLSRRPSPAGKAACRRRPCRQRSWRSVERRAQEPFPSFGVVRATVLRCSGPSRKLVRFGGRARVGSTSSTHRPSRITLYPQPLVGLSRRLCRRTDHSASRGNSRSCATRGPPCAAHAQPLCALP